MRIRSYTPPRSHPPQATKPAAPPLPYPDGWFCVGFSTEWPPGTVRTRPFMGEDLVIYRTRSGKLRASRPYCPHLGAHLGAGGKVDGEQLVCPFHKFSFNTEGKCVQTPFGPPPKASLKLIELTEAYGIVWAWHHHNDEAPTWKLPELGLTDGHPPLFKGTDMAGHPQEICENFFDYGHLQPLHGVEFLGEAAPPREDGQIYHLASTINRRLPLVGERQHSISAAVIGLGGIFVVMDLSQYGIHSVNWVLATPIAPWRVRVYLAVSSHVTWGRNSPALVRARVSGGAARAVSAGMLQGLAQDVRRDFPIWHQKTYLKHPKLSRADGLIGTYRKWARQFYPPSDQKAPSGSGG